jgi:ADP-ribosylglycohydrolase
MQLDYCKYYDKVLAGWLGKSIGGVVGAPYENLKCYNDLTLETLWPATMGANDDLDIQVAWLEALQERGVFLTSRDLAEVWQDRCWYWFCEYGVFLNNMQRGIAPPLSGIWNNNYFWESEGCPIRSEIWGFVAPGNPQLAASMARLDGQLDHGGNSVETEAFLSAAAAQALVSSSLDEAIEAGLSVIAADSPVALAVPKVRDICTRYPDPKHAWIQVIRTFGDRNANKALTNHALSLMALFLGKGDFKQTMLLCVNNGWDTDCTAATAGALLGALSGTAGLPADWVEQLGKTLICGINVKHRDALISTFAEDTCRIGVEMAAVRNSAITFINAPEVEIRSVPPSAISIDIDYPGEPVLKNAESTTVNVIINNPTTEITPGILSIVPAPGTTVAGADVEITLTPGYSQMVPVTITRTEPGSWLNDKNLFTAVFSNKDGEISSTVFGLGGARQWQAYGPYWEMWDSVRQPICPYYNDEVKKAPFMANLTGDCYNHYVRIDKEYLDERRLMKEDIPEEFPLLMERGEEIITESHLGGFTGQGCYYMVRTIQATNGPSDATLLVGRVGSYRLWIDGIEIAAENGPRGWCSYEEPGVKIKLTGKPQRIVVKLLRQSDAFSFSLNFMCKGDPEYKRGISNIMDSLSDLPV